MKVLVWNIDWFVPKCGMREEALRRPYIILIDVKMRTSGGGSKSLIFDRIDEYILP